MSEDFPQLCESCLGPNPYVRMIKLPPGSKLCKITNLPYQAFRWKAGPTGRHKETIISLTVAQSRNICQCCLNDLQFGVPVGLRDSILKQQSKLQQQLSISTPDSIVGQQYMYQQIEKQQQNNNSGVSNLMLPQAEASLQTKNLERFANQFNANLANNNKKTFKNLPKLCSFWLNGTCNRVGRGSCPFRPCCGDFLFPEIASNKELHEKLIKDLKEKGAESVMKRLSTEIRQAFQDALKGNREESIRKRVAGTDELSKKYINKYNSSDIELKPPSDQSIVTIWIGNLPPNITEYELNSAIFIYGHYSSLFISRSSNCAFVEYPNRAAAEWAASHMYNTLQINGQILPVNWAKPKNKDEDKEVESNLLPPPPGMEKTSLSSYALPNLPLPSISNDNNNNNKRKNNNNDESNQNENKKKIKIDEPSPLSLLAGYEDTEES